MRPYLLRDIRAQIAIDFFLILPKKYPLDKHLSAGISLLLVYRVDYPSRTV